MSEIADIYDAVVVEMTALLPNHTRIPNPYSLEDNPDMFLKKGWGVAIGTSTQRELDFCRLQMERTFSLITTREVFYLDTKGDAFDAMVKELIDDHTLIQTEFHKADEIGQAAKIDLITVSSCSGPEVVFGEKFKYLTMSTEILVAHSDVVTG